MQCSEKKEWISCRGQHPACLAPPRREPRHGWTGVCTAWYHSSFICRSRIIAPVCGTPGFAVPDITTSGRCVATCLEGEVG